MQTVRLPAWALIEMRRQLVQAARMETAGVVLLVPGLMALIGMAAGPEPFEMLRAGLPLGAVFSGVVLLRAGRRTRRNIETVIERVAERVG